MKTRHDRLRIFLGLLQLLVGVGALGGGIALVYKPDGSALGIPLELLHGSPFPDYLIPGMVLLVFNGIGSLVAGILTYRRYLYTGELAFIFGGGLMIWIVVQVMILGYHWMHGLYFSIGLSELILGLFLRPAMRRSK